MVEWKAICRICSTVIRGFALRTCSGSNFVWIILLGRLGGRKLDAKRWNWRDFRRYVGDNVGLGSIRDVLRGDIRIGAWENALESLVAKAGSEGEHGGCMERFGSADGAPRGSDRRDIRKRALGIIVKVG